MNIVTAYSPQIVVNRISDQNVDDFLNKVIEHSGHIVMGTLKLIILHGLTNLDDKFEFSIE